MTVTSRGGVGHPLEEPAQLRRYRAQDPLTHGVVRGDWLLAHLSGAGAVLGQRLLDIGCGYGGLSVAYAKAGRTAVAMDVRARNVEVVRDRHRAGEGREGSVRPIVASAFDIPLRDATVDLVLMIGVIEWLGYADRSRRVPEAQRAALEECRRVLRPGGSLVVGTKNRLFPRYFWRDAQTGRPFVNALPTAWADWMSSRLWGTRHRSRIYALRGWRRLITDAGLVLRRVFVPVFNYQFPLVLAAPWRRVSIDGQLRAATHGLDPALRYAAIDVGRRGRSTYYSCLAKLGLLGAGGGSFLFVCERRA
jgi:SAM-dependent methyltransferase